MPVGRTGMTGVRSRRLVCVWRRARVTLKHAVARVCFLLRWAQRASVTFTRACGEGFPALLAISGGVNGAGALSLTPWCSRAPQAENGTARGLSDRAQRGSSAAPVFCRGAQGSRCAAPTKPWGAFSFRLFSLGKQRKGTCVRGSPRFQNRVRAAARIPITRNPQTPGTQNPSSTTSCPTTAHTAAVKLDRSSSAITNGGIR